MATDYDTARENYQNFRFCYENGHQQWLIKADRCIRFYNGDQWSLHDKLKLQNARRPALTFNIIESLIRTMKGVQRTLRNDVRFAPVADTDNDTAQVQDSLWLHTQNQNKFEFIESELFEHGLVTGRSYADVRVDFDEQLQGQIKIEKLRSQDVILDPFIDNYDPSYWPQVITSRWTNLLDIHHKFGKDKADALRSNGMPPWYDYEDELMASSLTRVPYYLGGWEFGVDRELVRALRILDRQYRKLVRREMFVDMQTGDMSEVPQTWDRDRIAHVLQATPGLNIIKRQIKKIHWTITCENEVLHDDESPYGWFTPVPYFPGFYDGNTMGLVETLIDPQELFNKVSSQELHIINTTASSGYKLKTGALKNMTVEELEQSGAKSGIVIELDDITNLEKIQPNQVPQGHDRISMKADSIMRNLSGMSNQSRGFAREDVAGEAILANQAASDTNLASWLANLHRTKQIIAMHTLDCVQDYYTETRAIMINRGSTFRPDFQKLGINQPTPEGTVVNDVTKGKYTTVLVPAPARTTLSESEFEQLVTMRKDLGIQIPDAMLIELSNLPNKGQLVHQLQGDANAAQQKQQQLQEQMQQLEMQLAQAKADKEHAQAELSSARAYKARVEADRDPNESYAQIEQQRIATDASVERERMSVQREKIMHDSTLKRRGQDHDTALALTQIDAENQRHTKQLEAAEKRPKGDKANG